MILVKHVITFLMGVVFGILGYTLANGDFIITYLVLTLGCR